MVGVIVVSKFITHDNKNKFAGMVDYMDRDEAITNNNISFGIKDVELDNIERRIFSVINKSGSTDINILAKDEILKNMICFELKLIDKLNNLTRYDSKYILKLVRDKKYLKSIHIKLLNDFNVESKEGKNIYDYIIKRVNNNVKYGFIKVNKGKLEITEKGLIEEDKIKNPHMKFIEEKLKYLEVKSDEFKRKKTIIDEEYSVLSELEYSGMIDYMDREKAKIDISKNDIGLFTDNRDKLNSTEKNNLKNIFNKCQENGGIMWHDVISFDNKFLEKYGIYDSKNKVLDNRKLKEVVRSSVNEMLKKENLNKLAVWCADIHYNTDNIHVHVSTVELNPSKTRGKRKQKSIFTMKSKIINEIINNNEQYKKINDIIRKDIIENKKKVKSLDNIKLKKLFIEIHSKLPEDRKQWNYNYNTLNHVRPLIDKMTEIYIEKYHKEDFSKLKEELKKQELNLKEAYGEGKNNSYKKYYDTKIKDLRTRMGNTILKEIKEYDYNLSGRKYKKNLCKTDRKVLIKNSTVAVSLKKIEKFIENNYQHYKNQKEYEKLQNEIERNE